MIKKIVEISRAGTYLSIRYQQLVIEQKDQESRSIPCEDIGVLLVDHSGVVYTHSVFTELLRHNAAVVLCGRDHHPTGMFLPLESNQIQSERFAGQIGLKEPVKKRLWQQVIRAKIHHQAKVVSYDEKTSRALLGLRDRVRSGDPDNVEAQASRRFWPAYFQHLGCKRDMNGGGVNGLLNYGYMAMRAAVARAICSAGLLVTAGIHHHNRYNAFCLADDMSEPFRGFVEKKVRELCRDMQEVPEMDQHTKAGLLEVLYEEVEIGEYRGPLMVGLHRTMASLGRCFRGEQKKLDLPKL